MSISRWPLIDLDRFLEEAVRAQNASVTPFEDQQNSRSLKPRYALHAFGFYTGILTESSVQDGPSREP